MRTLIFARRNIMEMLRDVLNILFCLVFPVVLLLIFQLIFSNIPNMDISQVPQFQITSLTSSMIIFGFSFIAMFAGMLISQDRATSFQSRLNSSPMKSIELLLGYMLPLFIIAFIQIVIIIIVALMFGLVFSASLLLAVAASIPSAILFIGIGLLLGSLFKDKAVAGMSTVLVNFAAIFGGMFFPLEIMGGAMVVITNIFPFVHGINLVKYALTGNVSNILMSVLILLGYTVVIFALAIFVFNKKMKSDKK